MPGWLRRFITPDATAVNVPTTTETVVQTLTVPSNNGPGAVFTLVGRVNHTAGTTTTAVVLRIRRGSLTGTVIGATETDTLAAAALASIPISADETQAAEIANAVYVLTIQQTGATANGTTNVAHLEALV